MAETDPTRKVWVVEVRYWHREGLSPPWHPTVGVGLTRMDGRRVLSDWKRRNPDDSFRLVPYTAPRP